MEEKSHESRGSSAKQIEINDLDEILLDDKMMSAAPESENNLSTERIEVRSGSRKKRPDSKY